MRKAIELYIVTQTTGVQLVHWLRARCVFKMCAVCSTRPRVVYMLYIIYLFTLTCGAVSWSLGMRVFKFE